MNIEDKVDEVVDHFLTNYYSWTENSQKEGVNALGLYANDYIYSMYEDIDEDIDQEEFDEVYDRVMAELEEALKEDIEKWVIW